MTKIKEMSERKSKLIETPLANNPHPKDLSKSPAVAGFFVSPTLVLTFICNKGVRNEKT